VTFLHGREPLLLTAPPSFSPLLCSRLSPGCVLTPPGSRRSPSARGGFPSFYCVVPPPFSAFPAMTPLSLFADPRRVTSSFSLPSSFFCVISTPLAAPCFTYLTGLACKTLRKFPLSLGQPRSLRFPPLFLMAFFPREKLFDGLITWQSRA